VDEQVISGKLTYQELSGIIADLAEQEAKIKGEDEEEWME
jgi:hypothetical protein